MATQHRIRTIFFDIGNVLVRFNWNKTYAAFAKQSGLSQQALARLFWGNSPITGLERVYGLGRITTPEFYHVVMEKIGAMPYEQFRSYWNDIFSPIVRMHELVSKLHGAGYRLVIISNINDLHLTHLVNTYRVFDCFDSIIASHVVRAKKPQPQIWLAAMGVAEAKPAECLFADDMKENTDSFRKYANVEGFVFSENRYAAFEEFLRSRGVRW